MGLKRHDFLLRCIIFIFFFALVWICFFQVVDSLRKISRESDTEGQMISLRIAEHLVHKNVNH